MGQPLGSALWPLGLQKTPSFPGSVTAGVNTLWVPSLYLALGESLVEWLLFS